MKGFSVISQKSFDKTCKVLKMLKDRVCMYSQGNWIIIKDEMWIFEYQFQCRNP